jgi:hypothetical protein
MEDEEAYKIVGRYRLGSTIGEGSFGKYVGSGSANWAMLVPVN